MNLVPNPLHDVHHKNSFLGTWYLKLVTSAKQSPLLRQIFGAGVGALVALVMYEGFAFASPMVMEMFTTHDIAAEKQAIEEETQDSKLDRVGALAGEKLEDLRTSAPEMFGNE